MIILTSLSIISWPLIKEEAMPITLLLEPALH